MTILRNTTIWLRDNLSNLFAIIGILLTIYLGVFYVPGYVRDYEMREISSAHESLVTSVQELIYNDLPLDSHDLDTLIKGKELSQGIVYPFTPDELLIQVQDRFLSNQFIPLSQRKNLVEKIDDIRSVLPTPTNQIPEVDDKPISLANAVSFLSIFLGISASILGLIGVTARSKKIKEESISESVEERTEAIKKDIHAGVMLENKVREILLNLFGQESVHFAKAGAPIDFILKTSNEKRVGVETIYTETDLIPVRVINRLIQSSVEMDMPVLLLSNASPSRNSKILLKEFNSKSRYQIFHINLVENENAENEIRSFIERIA